MLFVDHLTSTLVYTLKNVPFRVFVLTNMFTGLCNLTELNFQADYEDDLPCIQIMIKMIDKCVIETYRVMQCLYT